MSQLEIPAEGSKSIEMEFVFGGTFDPVHFGHLAIIETLQKLAPNTNIRIMPCALPVLKKKPQTDFNDRLKMLKLALADYSSLSQAKVIIDTREALRDEPSYTVKSLDELTQEFQQRRFVLVMGSDTLAGMDKWFGKEQLVKLCHLLVINRGEESSLVYNSSIGAPSFEWTKQLSELQEQASGRIFSLKMPDKPHSSTQIRKAVLNNEPLGALLPQSVIEYLSKNHLYKSETI